MLSRSRSRNLGAVSNGKAWTTCCAVHCADGLEVTLKYTTRLRSCETMTSTDRMRKVAVTTTKKSMPTVQSRWFSRNVRHVWDGGPRRFGLYFRTVESLTWIPSLASSAWMRGLPQVGFVSHIWRINLRTSGTTLGRAPFGRLF